MKPRKNKPFARQIKHDAKAPRLRTFECPAGVPLESIGLIVEGNCLAPRVSHGQALLAESKIPDVGDLAIVWLKGARMPIVKVLSRPIYGCPHHPESDVVHVLELEQLNPPRRYRVPMDKVDCIGRAVS